MTDIAVVVPCHNLGHTLLEAIDSVIAQTRPACEILVVDDGSTDPRTQEVLDRLSRPRTRVVHTSHRGPAAPGPGRSATATGRGARRRR